MAMRWLATMRGSFGRTWAGRWLRLRMRYHLRIRPSLTRQLRHIRARGAAAPKKVRVLAPLIETSHYRYYHYLMLAKALEMRGAEVKLLLCGSLLPGCELKSVRSPRRDPCMNCRFNARAVVPRYGLDVVRLAELVPPEKVAALRAEAARLAENYPTSHVYGGVDVIPVVSDSVVRYFYGATPAEGSPALRQARHDHLVSTFIGIEAVHALQASFDPQVVFAYMSAYSAWAPYEQWFARRGVPVVNLTSTQYDYSTVNVNVPELYFSKDRFDKYRATRPSAELTPDERAELRKILDERFSGRAQVFDALGFFAGADRSVADALHIDESKRNLFLFSNIFWDVGLSERAKLFPGVIEWVISTIESVAGRPDCHLYIKPHPGEKFDSAPSLKGVVDHVRERFPQLPANVSFITPEMKIKPYDLAPFADLAIVYSGTLGLEMMLHGVPVVACGLSPYGGPGLALEPQSVADYRDILTGRTAAPPPQRAALELFAYFFFVKLQIPWTLTERAYADDFSGYTVESLDDLQPGKNRYLDHLCNCVLHSRTTVSEAW